MGTHLSGISTVFLLKVIAKVAPLWVSWLLLLSHIAIYYELVVWILGSQSCVCVNSRRRIK